MTPHPIPLPSGERGRGGVGGIHDEEAFSPRPFSLGENDMQNFGRRKR